MGLAVIALTGLVRIVKVRLTHLVTTHSHGLLFSYERSDLELQWSTRHSLAQQSQKCGIKTLGRGIPALQECLESPLIGDTHGFTSQCAKCWAEDIFCTKQFCIFIYLQTRMTNQVGNFKVGPDSITSATCEEANCEAGKLLYVFIVAIVRFYSR